MLRVGRHIPGLVPPCRADLLAWPQTCHYGLTWQLDAWLRLVTIPMPALLAMLSDCAPASVGTVLLALRWVPAASSTPRGSTCPCCSLAPPGFRAALFPSHKGIRDSARKRLPCYFLSWTNKYIWLLWVSRSPFILLSLWWPHLKLYCESIQKFVFRWEVFPETLLLQGSCPADPHKWTNHVCERHTKTSCNLKWRLLSAFSTSTHCTQLAGMLRWSVEV